MKFEYSLLMAVLLTLCTSACVRIEIGDDTADKVL